MTAATTLMGVPLYWIQIIGGGDNHWYLCPNNTFEIYSVWHK